MAWKGEWNENAVVQPWEGCVTQAGEQTGCRTARARKRWAPLKIHWQPHEVGYRPWRRESGSELNPWVVVGGTQTFPTST